MVHIKNKVIGVVLFTIMAFFLFRHCSFIGVSAIGALSSSVMYPFLRMQQCVVEPINQWMSRRVTIRALEQVIECLHKENDSLLAENVSLKAMRYYTNKTAELCDFNKRYCLKKGRVVQVLARHFSSNNQFFLMDAGARQGIKKDMVALYCNCIVGRVSEVYPWYCKVHLITDAECKVAALCEKTGAGGIHEGVNDTYHTVVRHVSHLEKVALNSMILSSGEGLIFPCGFALGTIESVDKGELFYSIHVKPPVDFYSLSYCTLIAKEEIEGVS